MSFVLGQVTTNLAFWVLTQNDNRLFPLYQDMTRDRNRTQDRYQVTHYMGGFTTPWWPGGANFMGDHSSDVAIPRKVWSRRTSRIAWGGASRLGFVGTTRDAAGGRLGGVTCSLFKTSTKEWIMDIISDINGDFLLQSWYTPDTHFIVFYKSGTPDVAGATRQTLIGA